MKGGAPLALLALTLCGCAQVHALIIPPRQPAPAASAPAPPVAPSPFPTLTPAPAPAPPPAGPPGTPLTTLAPQMSVDQERRLREQAQRAVDETDRLLRQLEGRPLKPQERETFALALGFLDQARKALSAQEYERAANLATKARTLTDDLAAASR